MSISMTSASEQAEKAVPLIERIEQIAELLTPSERRLADYLMEFPGNVPTHTAIELAARTAVSNATVTRLFRRLGYVSFNDARREVRQEQLGGSPLLAAEAATGSAGLDAFLLEWTGNLRETFARTTDDEITAIAQALNKADRVLFSGYRANDSFARYLRWQLLRVLPNATVIPGGNETVSEHMVGIGKKDVLVCFTLRRTVATARALQEFAVKEGARCLCISDMHTADPGPATWHLRCHTHAAGAFDSHVAVMGMMHILATRVLEQSGKVGRERMARIESTYGKLDRM